MLPAPEHGLRPRQAHIASADRAAIIEDLLEGQYSDPVRVIAFNTVEGWSRDVSEEIADDIAARCAGADEDIPMSLQDFVGQHGSGRRAQLPLPLRKVG